MERFSRTNLENIKSIVERETGVQLVKRNYNARRNSSFTVRRVLAVAASLVCLITLSAFAYQKFNSIKGDELALKAVYLGDGKFDLVVKNMSDKKLVLEDKVKLERWSTSKAVEGESKKIKIEGRTIPAGETGVVKIDISEGYDIKKMEDELPVGDCYYFVLTNNSFVFGQDWMCSFNMSVSPIDTAEDVKEQDDLVALLVNDRGSGEEVQDSENEVVLPDEKVEPAPTNAETETSWMDAETGEVIPEPSGLVYSDWALPTKELNVTTYFGKITTPIGTTIDSNKINISGSDGDPIYAVADGIVEAVGYDDELGNVFTLSVGDGIEVIYGHLKKINVEKGDTVNKGDVIAQMGSTGMATGPNLAFSVTVNGKFVNPLK